MTDIRARLVDVLQKQSLSEAQWNYSDHVADVLLSLPGIAVVELPEPDMVGDFGKIWSTDKRLNGHVGTVQALPNGDVQIRDDFEYDYKPAALKLDAAALLAAAVQAQEAGQ